MGLLRVERLHLDDILRFLLVINQLLHIITCLVTAGALPSQLEIHHCIHAPRS